MLRRTQEIRESFGKTISRWALQGIIAAIIPTCCGLVALILVIVNGGRITALNFGPVQVDVDSLQPQNNSAAQDLTENLPLSTPQTTNPVPTQQVLDSRTSCSIEPGDFFLPYQQWMYESTGTYGIAYLFDGFVVFDPYHWDPTYGNNIPFPVTQIQQNVWIPLEGTLFQVCMDNNNLVYARFG